MSSGINDEAISARVTAFFNEHFTTILWVFANMHQFSCSCSRHMYEHMYVTLNGGVLHGFCVHLPADVDVSTLCLCVSWCTCLWRHGATGILGRWLSPALRTWSRSWRHARRCAWCSGRAPPYLSPDWQNLQDGGRMKRYERQGERKKEWEEKEEEEKTEERREKTCIHVCMRRGRWVECRGKCEWWAREKMESNRCLKQIKRE